MVKFSIFCQHNTIWSNKRAQWRMIYIAILHSSREVSTSLLYSLWNYNGVYLFHISIKFVFIATCLFQLKSSSFKYSHKKIDSSFPSNWAKIMNFFVFFRHFFRWINFSCEAAPYFFVMPPQRLLLCQWT